MPVIPATRKRTLSKPQQDQIQWTLTDGHSKRQCSSTINVENHSKATTTATITTEGIANKFVRFLLNTRDANEKLDQFAADITSLHQNLSFSLSQFIEIICEQDINSVRLLEYYLKLHTRLHVLALSLKLILLKIPNLDQVLTELINHDESVVEAYIPHMTDELLDELFEKDGSKLANYTATMEISNARRFQFILEYYAKSMPVDQLKNTLIRLMSLHKISPKETDENPSICFYRQLRHVKQFVFSNNQTQTKQYDSFLAKKPIFQLISQWFFEFNPKPDTLLTDFVSHIASVGSSLENGSQVMDISILLYSYFTACKNLNATGEDVLRIFDIIEAINNAVKRSLERDESSELGVVLTLSQIALEHMHTSVGYTYASWFEATFVKQSSTILDKRASVVFIKNLHQMTLYELPSVLQIHGRALANCETIPNVKNYISGVRKRLLVLGLNQHLRSYPLSLKTPLKLDTGTTEVASSDDPVGEIIQQFIQKGNIVPATLLQAHVFRKQWFISTFLPGLMSWNGENMEDRNNLIMALKKINKIPDSLYKPFIKQQKKKDK